MALSPEQEQMVERLMAKWGLDRNATVARIISESAREAQKAGEAFSSYPSVKYG